MSRGACICSSASRSRRRFPTAAAAPPAPALPIARWRTCSIVAAPFGRPTAMSIERRHPAAAERPRPIIAWRAPQVGWLIFPIIAAPRGRPTAMSTQWAAPRGGRTPAAGFAPPTRHARPLIFFPHATHRRQISSYKFLLSPSLFPVAAPIGPPLRAVGHRPAGTGAVCSSFLSAPRRRDSNGPFFSSSGSARSRRSARPPSGIRPRGAAPSAARRPFPHDLRRAVPGIPTVRRCPHPFTPFIPPIARAPRL